MSVLRVTCNVVAGTSAMVALLPVLLLAWAHLTGSDEQ